MSKKVLVVQTAFLGDFVLTTPVIRELSVRFGRENVCIVARPFAKEITYNRVFEFEKDRGSKMKIKSFFNVLHQIKSFSPNIVITPHNSVTSGLLTILSPGKKIGFEDNPLSLLFDIRVKKYVKVESEAERIFRILTPLGIDKNIKPEIKIDEGKVEYWRKFVDSLYIKNKKRKKILFGPFSNWRTKTWVWWKEFLSDAKNYEDNLLFILVGRDRVDVSGDYISKDFIRNIDGKNCSYEPAHSEKSNIFVNLAGKTSLQDVVSLAYICDAFLGVDNGISHICSALGKKTFVMFGPTIPEFGFFPAFSDFQVVEIHGLDCKPCSSHGPNFCPLGHFKCMKALTPKIIYALFRNFLGGNF